MFTRKSLAVAVLAAGAVYLPQAQAHHALEYIDTASYTITEKGQGIAYLLYDHSVGDTNDIGFDKWEFTPGLSYGATDWLMLDVHTHFAQFGRGELTDDFVGGLPGAANDPTTPQGRAEVLGSAPMLEAAAFNAQVAFPRFNDWVDVGFGTTIEVPFQQAKTALGAEGLGYEFQLILHREIAEHVMVTANLSHNMEEIDGDMEGTQSWRLGTRMPISPNPDGIAAGLELEGSFEESAWTWMPGIYAPLTNNAIAKMGLQIDGKETEAARFHASLMYLF